MDELTQAIRKLEDEIYGTDPEARRNRLLGIIKMGIETVCNLYEEGFAEDARTMANLIRNHVNSLRTDKEESA